MLLPITTPTIRPISTVTRRIISPKDILSARSVFWSSRTISRASMPRIIPIASTTSTPQLVYNSSLSQKSHTQDADWTRVIADEYEINGSPDLPWAAGIVAYRQCYHNCSALKWAAFRKEFDALMMKQWQQAPEKGGDSRGMMDRWKVFWREDEGLEDLSMDELRERFTARIEDHGENTSNQFFVVVNDEVVDSTLEGPAKGKIPFVYATDPSYEVEKEGEEEKEDDDDYKGQLKVAVELLPSFWCEAGPDDGRAMEKFRPCDGISTRIFNTGLLNRIGSTCF